MKFSYIGQRNPRTNQHPAGVWNTAQMDLNRSSMDQFFAVVSGTDTNISKHIESDSLEPLSKARMHSNLKKEHADETL